MTAPRGTELTVRNVLLAMNDIVRLRPLRDGWKHDRRRTVRLSLWVASWYAYFLAAVWWVSR